MKRKHLLLSAAFVLGISIGTTSHANELSFKTKQIDSGIVYFPNHNIANWVTVPVGYIPTKKRTVKFIERKHYKKPVKYQHSNSACIDKHSMKNLHYLVCSKQKKIN